jgi:hypothetical protein
MKLLRIAGDLIQPRCEVNGIERCGVSVLRTGFNKGHETLLFSWLRGVARRHDDYQSIAAALHGLHIEALADKVNAAKLNYKPSQRFTLHAGNSAYQLLGGDVDGDDKAELIAVRLTRFRAVI